MNNPSEEKAVKEEAISLFRQDLATPLRDVACDCTAPIFWHTRATQQRNTLMNSGTVIFVDAGSGPFVISARHVLEGFRKDRVEYHELVCQLDGIRGFLPIRFNPIERLIAEDKQADIATFSISPIEV